MAKIVGAYNGTVWSAVATNGSQPVVITPAKNADGSPVKDPHK